jgi:curved DNA-binding protein CbpA
MAIHRIESPLVRSYREILGVEPTASLEQIKKAHRRLVGLYHPDLNSDPKAIEDFHRVQKAYEVLSDQNEVDSLNRQFKTQQLMKEIVPGLNLTFGTFFGYRFFGSMAKPNPRALRLGVEKKNERDIAEDMQPRAGERNISILDSPAFDSFELIYAGKFSKDDEDRVRESLKPTYLSALPWVLLNNRGVFHFLDSEFEEALKCYQELNRRIPNNIIFLYRLGLCAALLAFRDPQKSFLGAKKPRDKWLSLAVESFRRAIQIGQQRTVGKQRCMLVRKTLADVLEKAGKARAARQVWAEIAAMDPKNREARRKTSGLATGILGGLAERLALLPSRRKNAN